MAIQGGKLDVLRGNLFRKEKGIFSDNWNIFWFHLEGDKLCYYKDESCLEHIGFYDLSAKGITVHPTTLGNPVLDSSKNKKYEFQLNIPKIPREQEGISVFLAVPKYSLLWYWVDGLLKWINAFKKAKAQNNKSKAKNYIQLLLIFLLIYSPSQYGSPWLRRHTALVKELEPVPAANDHQSETYAEKKEIPFKRQDSSIKSMDDAITIIVKLRAELEAERLNSALISKENETLKQQNEEACEHIQQLRQRYFFSIAMAMKLERSMSQTDSKSYNVQSLWNQIETQAIPFREWPEWLSNKFSVG